MITEEINEIFNWGASIAIAVIFLGGLGYAIFASYKIDKENQNKKAS